MVRVKLEVPCSKPYGQVSLNPAPDWSLDGLISELNALEGKLSDCFPAPTTLRRTKCRELSNQKNNPASSKPFVMHISDYEMEGTGSSDGDSFIMRVSDNEMEDTESSDGESYNRSLTTGRRFSFAELELSDTGSSEDELDQEIVQSHLVDKTGLVEGSLFEVEREYQLRVKEEIRNRFSALEAELANEYQRSASALTQAEKYMDAKRETDRKTDKQYQRKIAEALDNHISALQRDHEQISLIEERRIRSDAALEEYRRKEKALQEEKVRQEKAKAEAEARIKAAKMAEEVQKAALEAERRAAKEAAEKKVNEGAKIAGLAHNGSLDDIDNAETLGKVKQEESQSGNSVSQAPSAVPSAGAHIKATKSAIAIERERIEKLRQLDQMNQQFSSNKGFDGYKRQIARRANQISGNQENSRDKASDFIRIMKDPACPQCISIAKFAKEVVSKCENPSMSLTGNAFAYARVIAHVTSQVPIAMDIVLAEFHQACIYTIPKHINYSQVVFETEEAYYRTVGYQEDDGKIESTSRYLERMGSYVTLYAALVQTEIPGGRNLHGLMEGWAWLARFLNALPANQSTAVALLAFLKMAGYMLSKTYKSQFKKMLNVISREFLVSLKALGDAKLNPVITQIETYIETKQFLQEPEGWRPKTAVASKMY